MEIKMTEFRARVFYYLVLVSRTINWATGGSFQEPLCARVGRRVAQKAYPIWYWIALSVALDTTFWVCERRHCKKSFTRNHPKGCA